MFRQSSNVRSTTQSHFRAIQPNSRLIDADPTPRYVLLFGVGFCCGIALAELAMGIEEWVFGMALAFVAGAFISPWLLIWIGELGHRRAVQRANREIDQARRGQRVPRVVSGSGGLAGVSSPSPATRPISE